MATIYNDDLIPQKDLYIEMNGVCRIRVSKFGNGNKSIFLIPGIISPGLQYKFIFKDLLDSGFAFYAIDLPGWIGKSEIHNIEKMLKISHADVVDFTIKQLGFSEIDILGYSYGASIAIESSRNKKLALVSPVFNQELFKDLNYIRAVKFLKHFDFGNFIEKKFLKRYKNIADPSMQKQMTAESFDKYLELYSGVNLKIISRDLNDIFKINLLANLEYTNPKDVLYVHSKKEKEIFQNHHRYAKQNYNFSFLEYKTGHNGFALSPDNDVLSEILIFFG